VGDGKQVPVTVAMMDNTPTAIIGNTGSGKTNLLVFLARQQGGNRKKYLLGYPSLINGFIPLNSVEDLTLIQDCVLVIDELSRYFPPWERRTNQKLMELLQFAEHNNIKVMFSTQVTQSITKQLEAFIGQWAIKQIRMNTLKNGSTPKNILKHSIKHPNITTDMIKLGVDEYVWYNERATPGENGVRSFPCQGVLKDWKTATKTPTQTTIEVQR
jgi:hypothetical protein